MILRCIWRRDPVVRPGGWILAMKDENAEGQSRAIRYAIVGVALVCFKAFAAP